MCSHVCVFSIPVSLHLQLIATSCEGTVEWTELCNDKEDNMSHRQTRAQPCISYTPFAIRCLLKFITYMQSFCAFALLFCMGSGAAHTIWSMQ